MQGNVGRTDDFLNGLIVLGQNDVASDSDNIWTDGAIDDAHVYAGWTYDFYFQRFRRNGLDNRNILMRSLVHQSAGATLPSTSSRTTSTS